MPSASSRPANAEEGVHHQDATSRRGPVIRRSTQFGENKAVDGCLCDTGGGQQPEVEP